MAFFLFSGVPGSLSLVGDWVIDDSVIWTEGQADGLAVRSGADAILNVIRTTTIPREVDPAPSSLIYRQTNALRVNVGETREFGIQFRDDATGDQIGATEVQTPQAYIDYRFNSFQDGTGADLTADLQITMAPGQSGAWLTFTNTGATDGFIPAGGFTLTGRAIRTGTAVQSEGLPRQTDSITRYGERSAVVAMPYQSDPEVGQAAANYLLRMEANDVARADSVSIIARDQDTLTELLARDISDRVTVKETVTGINADFYINGIEWQILSNGLLAVTYTLAPAVDPYGGASIFIIGESLIGGPDVLIAF
jgi:hypothetical protein